MDVLIYLREILADLVVADLNPDQTPSLLNNPPDLEMSSKVMHSLRHSSLRLYSLSRHIQTTRSPYFRFSQALFLWLLPTSAKVKEWVCFMGVWGCKVSLCLHTCIKGQEDNLCHPYWFIFPGLLLLNCRDVLLLNVREVGAKQPSPSALWGESYKWSQQLSLRGWTLHGSESTCLCPRCHWLASLWTCKSHHLCTDAIRTAAASRSNKIQMVQTT